MKTKTKIRHRKKWRLAASSALMAGILSLGMFPSNVSAFSPLSGSFNTIFLEKEWQDDNNDNRPESVDYEVYMYQGEWSGKDQATHIGTSTAEADEQGKFTASVQLTNHMESMHGTPEGAASYKFRFVEQVPDGYIESDSSDAEVLVSEFSVGDAQPLELGPSGMQEHMCSYTIPNFDDILAAIKNNSTESNDATTMQTKAPLVVLQNLDINGSPQTVAFGFGAGAQSVILQNQYFINSEQIRQYVKDTYGPNATYKEIGENQLSELINGADQIVLGVDYPLENNPSGRCYFTLSNKGELTAVERYRYIQTGGVPFPEIRSPFFNTDQTPLISATYAMMTPEFLFLVSNAKSVNQLVNPVQVHVKKTWDDDNNKSNQRPSEVKVSLLANGETQDTQVLNDDNQWEFTWNDLPGSKDGVELEYTVAEERVPEGYTSEVTKADEKTVTNDNNKYTSMEYTITNKLKPEEEKPEEPTKPETKKPNNSVKSSVPKTGDTNNMMIYVLLILVSVTTLIILRYKRFHHSNK